jgi:hypothetical protein
MILSIGCPRSSPRLSPKKRISFVIERDAHFAAHDALA